MDQLAFFCTACLDKEHTPPDSTSQQEPLIVFINPKDQRLINKYICSLIDLIPLSTTRPPYSNLLDNALTSHVN